MERKVFIQELKNLKLVAHQLGHAMTEYPENSINVLQVIFNNEDLLNSCNGFEFDICFTKDHFPVVIHDKYLDDISDSFGFIRNHTISELKKINFGFRKSFDKKENNSFTFKIVTLEEILSFFADNLDLLNDKIIKIETKEAVKINKQNLYAFAEILSNFTMLSNNIVHLSYYPQNLYIFRKVQEQKNYKIVKSDLLCDYKIIVLLSRLFKCLDNISLRIKSKELIGKYSKNNSAKVNRHILLDSFFMKFSNTIDEKTIRYAINKFGSVGIYVLNGDNEISQFCHHISKDFFEKNSKQMVFTTNNPIYLRKLK